MSQGSYSGETASPLSSVCEVPWVEGFGGSYVAGLE